MNVRLTGLAFAVLAITPASSVRAEPPPPVLPALLPALLPAPLLVLDFRDCADVPVTEIRRMVGVELHRPVISSAPSTDANALAIQGITNVDVTCVALRAEIIVNDPLTGKSLTRTIDLAGTSVVARPHLLALSIVELVAASWLELQDGERRARGGVDDSDPANAQSAGSSQPAARAAALEVVRARHDLDRLTRIVAVASYQGTTSFGSWGAGVLGAGSVREPWGWLVDLDLHHGQRSFPLGVVTGDVGSVMLALTFGANLGRVELRSGVGARGGGAWFSGTATPSTGAVGGNVKGLWWGPAALVEVSFVVRGRVVLAAMIDAGHVLVPVVATVQGAPPLAIDGTWIRGTIGVGFTL